MGVYANYFSVSGSKKCLELLCEHYGAEIVKLKDARGRTPLHITALSGHMECARYLLEQGADIDGQDKDGRTPLISASQHGEIAMIGELEEENVQL